MCERICGPLCVCVRALVCVFMYHSYTLTRVHFSFMGRTENLFDWMFQGFNSVLKRQYVNDINLQTNSFCLGVSKQLKKDRENEKKNGYHGKPSVLVTLLNLFLYQSIQTVNFGMHYRGKKERKKGEHGGTSNDKTLTKINWEYFDLIMKKKLLRSI